MESGTQSVRSVPTAAGPQDLSEVELGVFGLGVVVRMLRVAGAAAAAPLRRVYCLFCGIAVDHEPAAAGWWFCRNECNARGSA
jgi:hypothetical protein